MCFASVWENKRCFPDKPFYGKGKTIVYLECLEYHREANQSPGRVCIYPGSLGEGHEPPKEVILRVSIICFLKAFEPIFPSF